MYFNYFTQTDTRQAQVYGVLVCNLICSSFHRFSRQEKDRLSCSALSNEDFCRENTDINLLVSRILNIEDKHTQNLLEILHA